MPRITKRIVDAIVPAKSAQYVWDDALPGFGLRVLPSGRKSYLVFYRNSHGRQRWLTIGQHGVFTPDQAREEARSILQRARVGEDPAADRRRERGAHDLNALLDRYVEQHVRVRNKMSTQMEVERLLTKHVRPALGSLKVGDVNSADVIRLHHAMRHAPRSANFVRAILSKVFNLAEVWGLRPANSNPCRLVQKYPEKHRERFLSLEELTRVGHALEAATIDPSIEKSAIEAIKLLALTGCRLSEILTLRWEYINQQRGGFALPDSKTGEKFVPVGGIVLEMLAAAQALSHSEWVISHKDQTKHLAKERVEKAWQKIRASVGLQDVRLHDFRHTVGTYAAGTGASAFLIRDKLGHSQVSTTDRYVNFDVSPTRALSDLIEKKIADALGQMLAQPSSKTS
jgi:integrase